MKVHEVFFKLEDIREPESLISKFKNLKFTELRTRVLSTGLKIVFFRALCVILQQFSYW